MVSEPSRRSRARSVLDAHDVALRADRQVLDHLGVHLVDEREALGVLPQELDHLELAQHAEHVVGPLAHDDEAVHARAEGLDGLGQLRRVRQDDEGLLGAQALGLLDGDGAAGLRFARQVLEEGQVLRVRPQAARGEEQVLIEVLVVERGHGRAVRGRDPHQ